MFVGPNIVTDGLVLALDTANVKSYPGSGTTWYDKSGNGNNGTLTNGPTFDSGNGGSIVFDGANDFVEFNNDSIFNFGTSNISFRFIVTTNNSTFDRWNALYIKRGSGSDDIRTYIRPQTSADGILRLYIAASTSMDITTPIINILGTFDINFVLIRSQYWAIYINGVLIGTNNTNNAFTDKQNSNISGPASPRFGNQLGGEYPNLNLFNFQIYNRALTAEEVLQNYNATKSRFGL